MVDAQNERERDVRYPISRWYVRPVAGWVARWLSGTRIRPSHLTAFGIAMAAIAVAILCASPECAPWAAIPIWLAWFFDRADGMLARCQKTISTWGAWFDANVDELVDLGLQVAVTIALAQQVDAPWPWFLLVAFLVGKYLLMYGLAFEESQVSPVACDGMENLDRTQGQACQSSSDLPLTGTRGQACQSGSDPPLTGMLRCLYHLPGNCDIRVHWLILMLLFQQLAIELAVVAFYYNVRWIVRYAIVWRRSRRSA